MTRYYHSLKHNCRIHSVTQHTLKIPGLFIFLTAIAVFISSCEENPTTIGNNLLPGSDFVTIKTIDTLSVYSYTELDDSIRTDNQGVSLMGQIYNPYFGTTTCEFVTQVRLKPAWDGKPFVVDSVKLHLRLYPLQGGSDVKYTMKITEIADQIYTDTAYYSITPLRTTDYNVSVDLPYLVTDSINDISVDMPVSFGEYLTRDTTKLFYNSSQTDLRSFIKGFHFQIVTNSDPLLASLSLSPPALGGEYYNYFTIFMHDDNGVKATYFILDATNNNARYNRFLHNLSTAEPDKAIKHVNDGYRDSLSYLQYLNGVYTKLVFKGLDKIKNDPNFANIAVNKAKLTVPVFFDGEVFKPSTVPPSLRMRYRSTKGLIYDVPDYSVDASHNFFDGKLDSVNNVYNFNISTFVQLYLQDKTGLVRPELEIFQLPTGTKNVIFKTSKNSTPLKFEFMYTKF